MDKGPTIRRFRWSKGMLLGSLNCRERDGRTDAKGGNQSFAAM